MLGCSAAATELLLRRSYCRDRATAAMELLLQQGRCCTCLLLGDVTRRLRFEIEGTTGMLLYIYILNKYYINIQFYFLFILNANIYYNYYYRTFIIFIYINI